MRSVRFTPLPVLLILLTLTLAASPALAAGGRSPQADRTSGLFVTVWQALGEFVPWLGVTRAGKLGSGMDPNGQRTSAGSETHRAGAGRPGGPVGGAAYRISVGAWQDATPTALAFTVAEPGRDPKEPG